MEALRVFLAPGTGAANSEVFEVDRSPIHCFQTGTPLAGGDVINLEYSTDGGTTFQPFLQFSTDNGFGAAVRNVVVTATGKYRWARGVIGTSTGVSGYAFPVR